MELSCKVRLHLYEDFSNDYQDVEIVGIEPMDNRYGICNIELYIYNYIYM